MARASRRRCQPDRGRPPTVMRSIQGQEVARKRDPEAASRAVKDYLATLDEAAFGAAIEAEPKFV